MYNIVLVYRTGGDFSLKDVELLAYHIHKNTDGFFNIYCLTDKTDNRYILNGFTLLPLPKPHYFGWWSKMHLFNPELDWLRPFLFMDLDTAIVGNGLIGLIEKIKNTDFITLEDFYRKGHVGGGLFSIPENNLKVEKIWKAWKGKENEIVKKFKGDQHFIESVTQPDYYWQKITNIVSSFKPIRQHWLETIPKNISVVCFHGYPRIQQARKVEWVNTYLKEYEQA